MYQRKKHLINTFIFIYISVPTKEQAHLIRDLGSSGLLLRLLRVDQREPDRRDQEEGEEELPQIHLWYPCQLHQLLSYSVT